MVRRANVDQATVDPLVGPDVGEPRLLAVGELSEPSAENVMLRQPIELGKLLDNILENFIIDLRLPGLLGAFLRDPAALLQQARDLLPRVQVGELGELLLQLELELVTARRPLRT